MSTNDTQKTGPRDVFSHLLAIIFLYVSIFSFGAIVFSFIDLYFPDLLAGDYGFYARASLRWPLAVLVIVFPLYVWLTHYLQKELLTHPAKRELKTRKWLLYFTLFASTIAIVIDLVMVLYQFLNGELSVHFVLKVLTVLAIAVAVFVYYLWSLRRDEPALRHPGMKVFVFGVLGIVAATIIFGFYVAGSPQSERLRRFDDRRIGDLSQLQTQIREYWQAKEKLPESLDDLRDEIGGLVPPHDPETDQPYEYRVISDKVFELCAVFKTSNKGVGESQPYPVSPYGIQETFEHNASRTCFARVIDPERYPPIKSLR